MKKLKFFLLAFMVMVGFQALFAQTSGAVNLSSFPLANSSEALGRLSDEGAAFKVNVMSVVPPGTIDYAVASRKLTAMMEAARLLMVNTPTGESVVTGINIAFADSNLNTAFPPEKPEKQDLVDFLYDLLKQ